MTIATRRIPGHPERVLAGLGRVLRASPYSLAFREVVGGHPLAGGVLRFTLPPHMGLRGAGAYWSNLARSGVREIDVELSPIEPESCDVRFTARSRRRVGRDGLSEMEAALTAVEREVHAGEVFAAR
jgi:hypothetical protein